MWKFKTNPGSKLVNSYKKGWELAVYRFEQMNLR